MLLTDDEIESCLLKNMGDTHNAAKAIEAAILAKLGAMDLPEPVVIDKHESGYEIRGSKKDQLRQAYAQGAGTKRNKPNAETYGERIRCSGACPISVVAGARKQGRQKAVTLRPQRIRSD